MHEHHYFDGKHQAISSCNPEGLGHTHRVVINGVSIETGLPRMTTRGHVHDYYVRTEKFTTGVPVTCR